MTAPLHRPIPRSPTMRLAPIPEVDETPRPATPMPKDDEKLPFPYGYTMIMIEDDEKHLLKARFTHEANLRRWQHIYNSDLKVSK